MKLTTRPVVGRLSVFCPLGQKCVVGGHNYSLLSHSRSILSKKPIRDIHPKKPARTRFAPSPTGKLHLGSLRTALYNFLLAKSTGGTFLLRLEDTDQRRLVPGAEQNIYDSLKWCGITYDEGPRVNEEKYGPFRQSDRTEIYRKYSEKLLASGHAYRCFCSKERLDGLRESAQKLRPPATSSYDRHCAHLSETEIQEKLEQKTPFTIRLKSPEQYEPFTDLLHGAINVQPQTNAIDRRYDDPILVKSDALPTYHFANVVDDHLMEITHVVRGEEWLPSTPKHIALYRAFGWTPPEFIHIPLLTSLSDKKLSKRRGDADVIALKDRGVLPEALVNFSVLFGWSPPREDAAKNHECFRLAELIKLFDLNNLTKGNAKVDDKKLWFFNKHYLSERLQDPEQLDQIVAELCQNFKKFYPNVSQSEIRRALQLVGNSLTTLEDLQRDFYYLFSKPTFKSNEHVRQFIQKQDLRQVQTILRQLENNITDNSDIASIIEQIARDVSVRKGVVFEVIRFALAASIPGVKIPFLIEFLGIQETKLRIEEAIKELGLTNDTS
ncbi:LAME_0A06172g1_1 [Lachancea meyersii CBS 8951]|uniref:Glutamate--tRNA ligase, mitochondrial n=1 Tax=Lachancea meyersii CBS 8951 TaxID=1266667 RepID=A0A1G4IQQ3_9SACH|nr:LAME_0A06172g1_1 [Lachancea meyersii CBS 8951]